MNELLNNKLDEILKKEKVAGMCVAITDRNKLIYKNGFGVESTFRPEVPTHPDALYKIASITKVVTGLCIMKLCEDGILSLDTPVGDYVPWLKLENEAEKMITLHHLLSHTSGLPKEYTPDGPREESALEESLKNELNGVKLCSMPDDRNYLYSNLGIRLASYIAEQKTGKPYSYLAREYVLNPLGMTRSTFDLRNAATYPLSLPHEDFNDSLLCDHYIKENAARLAAGGLYSNTEELSMLARCILNGGKSDRGKAIISPLAINEMTRPFSRIKDGVIDYYGLTMMKKKYKDGFMIGHRGNASPYGSGLFCDMEKGFGVVVLMNTFRSHLRTEIPEMILEMIQ
jgi:CubicO group peptidase (beta-lactamase class C family)